MRLIEERGIVDKRIVSIWLNNVEDITCKFGILGRIFSFGDLEIQSAGKFGKIVFSLLPSPRKFHQEIEKAILNLKNMAKVEPKNRIKEFRRLKGGSRCLFGEENSQSLNELFF